MFSKPLAKERASRSKKPGLTDCLCDETIYENPEMSEKEEYEIPEDLQVARRRIAKKKDQGKALVAYQQEDGNENRERGRNRENRREKREYRRKSSEERDKRILKLYLLELRNIIFTLMVLEVHRDHILYRVSYKFYEIQLHYRL